MIRMMALLVWLRLGLGLTTARDSRRVAAKTSFRGMHKKANSCAFVRVRSLLRLMQHAMALVVVLAPLVGCHRAALVTKCHCHHQSEGHLLHSEDIAYKQQQIPCVRTNEVRLS